MDAREYKKKNVTPIAAVIFLINRRISFATISTEY